MQGSGFWTVLLAIVLIYMTLWYAAARLIRRYDVVDSAWGMGFVLVAWVSLGLHGSFEPIQVISALLVSVWGLRLFIHIANRNWRKHEDDHRYQVLRAKWGAAEHRKAYTNIFLLQGALLTVVSLPMIAIALSNYQPSSLNVMGWIMWTSGIIFEAIADWQLARFIKQRPKGDQSIMDRGLWHYSRHPNYFGEIVTWWGAGIVALSAGQWWGLVGSVVITVLITRVSGIPPLEKHYDGNKAYEVYRQHTSVLIPLPPSRP